MGGTCHILNRTWKCSSVKFCTSISRDPVSNVLKTILQKLDKTQKSPTCGQPVPRLLRRRCHDIIAMDGGAGDHGGHDRHDHHYHDHHDNHHDNDDHGDHDDHDDHDDFHTDHHDHHE